MQDSPVSIKRNILEATLLFGPFFLIALWLAWPARNGFFIADDIAILYIANFDGDSWLQVLAPMSNGFRRPNILLLARILFSIFGPEPLPFHMAAVAFHSAAASALFLFIRRVGRSHVIPSIAAASIFLIHPGAWSPLVRYQNTCDSMLLLFTLLFLVAWNARHGERGKPASIVAFVFLLVAFGSKETAMVAPLLAVIWSWIERKSAARASSSGWSWIVLAVVSATYVGLTVAGLLSSQSSYIDATSVSAGEPLMTFNPIALLRRLTEYFISAFAPYLHVLPGISPGLPESAITRWVLPILCFLAISTTSIVLARKQLWFELGCVLSSILLLAPVSFRSGEPQSHYLYAGLGFIVAGVIVSILRIDSRARYLAWIAVAVCSAFLISGYKSTTAIRTYLIQARRIEAFVESSIDESATWAPGQIVAVLNHPHPGDPAGQYVYGQLLYWVYFPELRPKLFVLKYDEAPPPEALAYRFDGANLVPF